MSNNKRYVNPVILAEDLAAERKLRKVDIFRNEVFKDIDLVTHKHVDGNELASMKVSNAVSSDTSEDVDGTTLARYVEFRDAELRVKLQASLAETVAVTASDDIAIQDNRITYQFKVPDKFNDNTLKPLAEFIHRYLVFGALADWYGQFGMGEAAIYEKKLPGLLEKINGILRGPSITRRPMQPFGPAEKFM